MVFFLLCFRHIHEPVSQDSLWWLVAAKTYLSGGKPLYFDSFDHIQADSPHLYLLSLVVALKWFGMSEVAARLPGIIAGCLSILLIFITIVSLSSASPENSQRFALLMSILYTLSPMAVQGAVIIDIDHMVIIPPLLLFCLAFFKYFQKKKPRWAVLLSLAVMMTLWTKLTTTICVILIFIFFIFLHKENHRYKFIAMIAIVAGTVVFIVSWYLYCAWFQIPFKQPFVYVLSALTTQSSKITPVLLAKSFMYLALWASIPFIFLIILLVKQVLMGLSQRWRFRPEYGYLVAALTILIGYSVIGGANFGFPKYQSPAIAMAYIAAGLLFLNDKSSEWISVKMGSFVLMAAFGLHFFIIGDLLYTARYAMRELLVSSSEMYGRELVPFMIKIVLAISFYVGILASMYRFRKGQHLFTGILFLMLGTNTALIYLQARAPYQTGYSYGAQGTREAAEYILKTVPRESKIIAPSEIIYYVKPQPTSYQFDSFWSSPLQIMQQLNSPETACFVYGIASNTVDQVRLITSNGPITNILRRNYSHTKIGSYEIWTVKVYDQNADNKPS